MLNTQKENRCNSNKNLQNRKAQLLIMIMMKNGYRRLHLFDSIFSFTRRNFKRYTNFQRAATNLD